MIKTYILLLFLPICLLAQTDYELDFTSTTQDYAEMTNISSLIANSTTFSISCWVNPQSNTNHGGIIGFRDNSIADFYLLQLQNTNNIEARFRNSNGVNFDIVAANLLDFNQWQHLAFTYDGSYIRLYKNGVIVDSTAANGIITQTTESFRLGSLNYQGLEFYLIGRLDEVRLWNVDLSQIEINNWMCTDINMTHPNYNSLKGYWKLNEGQGTTAYDETSNGNDGILINSAATYQNATSCFGSTVIVLGCIDSLACNYNHLATIDDGSCTYLSPSVSILNGITCYGYTDGILNVLGSGGVMPYNYLWSSGDTSNTALNLSAGTHIVTVTDANGCSDTAHYYLAEPSPLAITVDSINETPILNDGSATTTALGGTPPYTYFWSDGQTTSTATNLAPGLYTVEVSDANGCYISDSTTVNAYTSTIVINIMNINKTLIKITDLLGRERKGTKNEPLFFIYDDGTIEKKIIIK